MLIGLNIELPFHFFENQKLGCTRTQKTGTETGSQCQAPQSRTEFETYLFQDTFCKEFVNSHSFSSLTETREKFSSLLELFNNNDSHPTPAASDPHHPPLHPEQGDDHLPHTVQGVLVSEISPNFN